VAKRMMSPSPDKSAIGDSIAKSAIADMFKCQRMATLAESLDVVGTGKIGKKIGIIGDKTDVSHSVGSG
jgi:hypothetical protein